MIERFGEAATARFTVSIGLINAWNVLTIASHRAERVGAAG
jgi:alkylhydroperoxidase family enzyme